MKGDQMTSEKTAAQFTTRIHNADYGTPLWSFLYAALALAFLATSFAMGRDEPTPAPKPEDLLIKRQTEFLFTDQKEAAPFLNCGVNSIAGRKIVDGALVGDVTGSDPYFSPVPVGVMRHEVNYIILEMSADTSGRPAEAQFFFNLKNMIDKSSFDGVPLIADGQMHRYVVDMRKTTDWSLTRIIYNMRIDPVEPGKAGDKFAIKSIRLVSGHVEPERPLLTIVPKTKIKPEIDGNIETDCWKNVYDGGDFQLLDAQGQPQLQTRVMLCHDDENLYIGFKAEIENVNYMAQNNERDSAVWQDDCIEIFIQPNEDSFYQMVMNPAQGRYDSKIKLVHGCETETDKSWNGSWRAASKITAGLWSGTIAIPFKDFPSTGSGLPSWKVNITREGKEYSSWNFITERFHAPKYFRQLEFSGGDRKSPMAALKSWGNLYTGANQAEIQLLDAAGNESLKCSAVLVNKADMVTQNGTAAPVAGVSGVIPASYAIPGPGDYELGLSLHDDKHCYFFTGLEFTVKDPAEILTRLRDELQKVPNYSGVEVTISDDLLKRRDSLSARVDQFMKGLTAEKTLDLLKLKELEKDIADYCLDARLQALKLEMRSKFGLPKPEYAVGQESAMRKVFKKVYGKAPPFRGQVKREIQLCAAKNEIEGIQLVLIPFENELKNVQITATDLTDGKAVIPSNRVEISLVGYISTGGLKTKYKSVYEGDWPDPLMPNRPFNVPARSSQPVWLNVNVPAGAAAGDYTGNITIVPENAAPVSIPLKLKVWDFELPRTPALRTALSVNEHYIKWYHEALLGHKLTDEERSQLWGTIYSSLLKHKLSVGNIYDGIGFPKYFPPDSQWQALFAQGQNTLPVGCLNANDGDNYYSAPAARVDAILRPQIEPLKQALIKIYEQAGKLGIQDKLYLHAFDEIFAYTENTAKARLLREIVLEWKKAVPELKVECVTYVMPELIGAVDVWCPDFDMYEKEPDKFEERRKAGDELWFYTCLGSPEHGWKPSFVLEAEGIDLRLVPWICKKYHATGFLYYALADCKKNYPANGKAWPEVPWQSQNVIGYNGEATFFYPGPTINDQLISSVRIQNFRDGIEDYDYLVILEKLTNEIKKNRDLSSDAKLLLEQAEAIIRVNDHILKNSKERAMDPKIVMAEREKIAGLILKLSALTNPAAGSSEGTLIKNGSFEEDADNDGVPDGWRTSKSDCASLSKEFSQTGKYSVKISNAVQQLVYWGYFGIPVVPGKQKYKVTFSVMTEKFGEEYIAYVEGAKNNSYALGAGKYGDQGQGKGTWHKKKFTFDMPNPEKADTIYLILGMNNPGTVWFDDVRMEVVRPVARPPLEINLRRPCYRNTIYDSEVCPRIEGEILLNMDCPSGMCAVCVKDLSGKQYAQTNLPCAGKERKMIFDMQADALLAGNYTVNAEMREEASGQTLTASVPLRRLDIAKGEIRFREDNVMLIEGKPFFPIGLWWEAVNFGEIASAGFNLIRCGDPDRPIPSEFQAELKKMDKYGLKGFGEVSYNCIRNKDQFTERIKRGAKNVEGNTTFLGWAVDEPVWSGISSDYAENFYQAVTRNDLFHFNWGNHAPRNTIDDLTEWNRYVDITGCDIYPVAASSPHSDLPNSTISVVGDETVKQSMTVAGRKPVWMLLQGFSWQDLDHKPNPQYPTWEETRFMTYDAVINGAKGIFWWGTRMTPKPSPFWSDLKRMAGELRDISTVLVSQDVNIPLIIEDVQPEQIRYMLKECEGKIYLFVENRCKNGTEITVKNIPVKAKFLQVLFENRKLAVKEGTLRDVLPPYGIHIYTDAETLPAPLVPATPAALRYPQNAEKLEQLVGKGVVSKEWNAQWIWYPGYLETPYCVMYARKILQLDSKPEEAWFQVAADDEYVLYVNGKRIHMSGGWEIGQVFSIGDQLKQGKNVIAIEGRNGVANAGIILQGTIRTRKETVRVLTDSSWKVSLKAEQGWMEGSFDDTRWETAYSLGKPPVKPWGKTGIYMMEATEE